MLKVVIVEDEEIIRKGMVHTIDWLALDCTIVGDAADGVEGLRMIEELKPDLVIADIRMPFMTGIDMLEKARLTTRFQSIILTSYSDFEYARKAISLKVYEYLLKPVDEDRLVEIIHRIHQKVREERVYEDILKMAKNGKDVILMDLDVFIQQGGENNYYVREVLNQIKNNYSHKLSIEGIAAELGVSPSYLSRKFKETTSQTFLDALNKYRIQKAIELLGLGRYRINEISDMTGFSEYKHFCSVFRKYTQTSPTEFSRSKGHVIHKSNGK